MPVGQNAASMETAGVSSTSTTVVGAERERPRMDPPNVLWFFGAFAIGFASIAVINKVPESNRDVWELLVSLAFFAVYAVGAAIFLRAGWWIPGGLSAAIAVAIVPAIGYGITKLIGTLPTNPDFAPFQKPSWSYWLIGLGTILVGLVAFALTRFPFIFFTVTLATAITAHFFLPVVKDNPGADAHLVTAIIVGAALVAIGLLLDLAGRRRDAFWFHVIGFFGIAFALAFYATGFSGDSNRGWVPMIIAGGVVLLASAPLRRGTWTLYGVLGFYAAIFHWLSNGINASSTGYALLLLAIGASIFGLGLALHRYGRVWPRDRPVAPPPAAP